MFKVFSLIIVLASSYVASEKNVVCYYGSWATYRPGDGKFDVSHINADLCTHMVYSFVGINERSEVVSLDPFLDLPDNWGRNNFGEFNALKLKNPRIKTILAVGGWNEGSARFSVMAADPILRQTFIISALKMILDYGFDGLDLDWEYPNSRDTVHGAADVENFVILLREMRPVFDNYGLLLTAAVASAKASAELYYDIPEISKYLDLINLMTYDMYGSWDLVTGHNAPLHPGIGDQGKDPNELFTVEAALRHWIGQVPNPKKVVVGVPFYGQSFTLADPNNVEVRAPALGAGLAGPYTGTSGFLGYNEFCKKLKTESWTQRCDSFAKVPYAYSGINWVSYDNVDSIADKVDYALKFGVGGIMIWSIETDDFHGSCGDGDFPLLRVVNKALGRTVPHSAASTARISSTRIESPSTIWSSTATTGTHFTCTEEGVTANPYDCRTFFNCFADKDGNLVPAEMKCPEPLLFDLNTNACKFADLVNCGGN